MVVHMSIHVWYKGIRYKHFQFSIHFEMTILVMSQLYIFLNALYLQGYGIFPAQVYTVMILSYKFTNISYIVLPLFTCYAIPELQYLDE